MNLLIRFVPFTLTLLEQLELLDKVEFELGTQPCSKLKGNVLLRKSSAIPARARPNADRTRGLDPSLG